MLSVCPQQSVSGELSLKQDQIRKTAGVENIVNNMAGGDIDGGNVATFVDLFLGITFWFLASFSMLLCYMKQNAIGRPLVRGPHLSFPFWRPLVWAGPPCGPLSRSGLTR